MSDILSTALIQNGRYKQDVRCLLEVNEYTIALAEMRTILCQATNKYIHLRSRVNLTSA